MKNIYAIDCIERYKFFRRVDDSSNTKSIFITHRLGLYIYMIMKGKKAKLVRRNVRLSKESEAALVCQDYLAGWLSNVEARELYQSTSNMIREVVDSGDQVFLWNGSRTFESAICKSIHENGKGSLLFFENANITGKLFVDPKGVNAASQYYNDVVTGNNDYITNNMVEFYSWKTKYISDKLEQHLVRQSVRKFSLLNKLLHVIDKLGFVLRVSPKSEMIINLKAKVSTEYLYTTSSVGSGFVFFPLQVLSDSQVLLNSDLNMRDAMLKALEIANKLNLKLVIKPHPAETSGEQIEFVNSFCSKNNVLLTDENTFKLINDSNVIVTINSTVGLEAKLLEKDVIVLGRAFYKNFSKHELAGYVTKFLLDVDYFDDSTISDSEYKSMISRLRFGNK